MNHLMTTRLATALLLAAATTLAACPAEKKPDEKPTEKTTKKVETKKPEAKPPAPKPPTVAELGLPAFAPIQTVNAAPVIKKLESKGGVTAYMVGDLMVLHKPTPANQVVNAQLYFLGGTSHLTAKTSGLERLALSVAADGGTTSTPKDAFNAKLASMGASIGSFTDRDYAGLSMKCVVNSFDDVWNLFVQVVTRPAMPEQETKLIKQRQLAQIDSIEQNPDALVGHIATKMLFKGHPYANRQLGTRATVSQFTHEHAKAYQRMLVNPKNMLLVVVGDVKADVLLKRVQRSLAAIKGRDTKTLPVPAFKPTAPGFVMRERPLPTNYIFGLFNAPAPGHPDYPAMVVAMDYLADRLFEEVRTKRNLTYAVSAGISARKGNYGYLYVTAVKPEQTLPVMFAEVDKLKNKKLSKQQITETLNVFITDYYMDLETNGSQAGLLANAQILTGDWKNADAFLGQVKQVTADDIQRVVKKYVKNLQFGVVGKSESALNKDIFKK